MKNEDYIKPDPIELEFFRTELIDKTLNSSSNLNKLLLFVNYFEKILSFNNPNFDEAFLKEFIEDYLTIIKKFEVWGIDPEFSKRLIENFRLLSQAKFSEEYKSLINIEIERLNEQLHNLYKILDGKDFEPNLPQKAFFPLIDNEVSGGFYGMIDSITTRINKTNECDKFLIIPSEKEIEKRIQEQCSISWQLALNISKQYIKKTYEYHEIIISFDKKIGFYEGNSLGIALTLSFLEHLLKFYNPSYIINIKDRTAFTGGVKQSGQIIDTSEDIIKRKVEAIFFSEINLFVIPKLDESYAYFALTQLKQKYPDRNLKLIPVEDFTDVLNRRDIVDIKKQKLVIRSGKFVKKNWISAVVTVLLAIVFAYLFVMDFDDNPASLYSDGTKLFVKNKNGKVLWAQNVNLNIDILTYPELMKNYAKIMDINEDGENELLFIQTALDEKNEKQDRGTIICFDKYQKIKWKYTFQDTVYSERENLQPLYSTYLIDTTTIENKKVVLCYANNATSFSSAIFALEFKTGERINKTQWNSGFTWDAIIIDTEGENDKEVVAIGADNGLKDLVIWSMKLKNINGYRPTTLNYKIKNFDETELLFYIRIPKTDYDSLNEVRTLGLLTGTLVYEKVGHNIRFSTISQVNKSSDQTIPSFHFNLNTETMDFNICLVDKFTSKRDSLIAIEKLNRPYTDTKEYKEIIKNNILYWKEGIWLKHKEIL